MAAAINALTADLQSERRTGTSGLVDNLKVVEKVEPIWGRGGRGQSEGVTAVRRGLVT